MTPGFLGWKNAESRGLISLLQQQIDAECLSGSRHCAEGGHREELERFCTLESKACSLQGKPQFWTSGI